MGLAWAQPASLAGLPARPHPDRIDGRSHLPGHGQQMDSTTPKTITLRCRCRRAHRPAARALAEAGPSAGFRSRRTCNESDRHPNSFDPGRGPCPPTQPVRPAGGVVKGYQQEKARVWLVSAQASRAVPCSKSTGLHHPLSCPNSNDIPAIERLDRPEHAGAAEDQGQRELDGLQLPCLEAGAAHRPRMFGQQSLGTVGSTCGRRRKAASPHVRIPASAAGDFVVHREPRHRPLLKPRNLAISGGIPATTWCVQYADGTLRVAGRTSSARPRPLPGQQATPQTRSQTAWAGWPGAGPRNGPSRPVRKVAARILVKALCRNATRPPGSPSPPMAPGSWRLEDFLPLRAHPRPVQERDREVKRDMEEAPAPQWTGGLGGEWARQNRSGRIRALYQGGDKRQGRPPCSLPPRCWTQASHWRTLSDAFAPFTQSSGPAEPASDQQRNARRSSKGSRAGTV